MIDRLETWVNEFPITSIEDGLAESDWFGWKELTARLGSQVMLIGDVAIVGVPSEFFTKLGRDIKERSPFRYTFIAELANDWIGYLPDLEAHKLGGYQTWTGLHSYAEPGTGERVVEEAVKMLNELPKAN